MKKLLFQTLLLIINFTVFAQNFPVQSNIFIAPPYSVYLSDYASINSQKLMVNLLLKDITQQSVQVRLRFTIKSNSIELRTKPEYRPPPITISGGVPLQLSGTDLASYLNPDNLIYTGTNKQQFLKTGKLPEGVYQFMVEAIEYRREVAVSDIGMTVGWLVLNDPPRWTLPITSSILTATYPQNVFFSWMPMNTSSPNSAFTTEYEFTLVEIIPEGRNPNDAINSTVPLFQTVTNNTSLFYSAGEPELVPGHKYVCRLRAKDTENRDLFKNGGYSEILVFTFGQACKPPSTITHKVSGWQEARVDWIPTPGNTQFVLSYAEKNADASWSNWYNNQTMMPWSNIKDLKDDHTYRYRLQATCGTILSDYSAISEFSTPKKDRAEIECGEDLSIPKIDGSPPLQQLMPGDMINVGGFDARVYEASGSNGIFSGKCAVHVTTFKFWVQSEFTGIGINQSMQVTSGTINAIKGKLNLLDIDVLLDSLGIDRGNDDMATGDPNVGDPYVPGKPITVIIDGETIIVTGDTTFTTEDGIVVVVTLGGQPPTIMADGKTTEVTTDVLDFDNPMGTGNDGTHPVADNAKYSINYVQFTGYNDPNGNKFGFDAYPSAIPQILKEYKKEKVLDKDYIIPWQSAEANGKPALVNMHIQTKVPDSIQSRLKVEMNSQKLTFASSPKGDTIRILNLTGQGNKHEDLITASYLNDAEKEIPIGFLNLVSYTRQTLKLVIVPVDGTFSYSAQAVQKYLDEVYAPAMTNWEVSIGGPLTVSYDEGEKNGLNTSRTIISKFNSEMNAIVDAQEKLGVINNTYYLFVMEKAEKESLNGLMPFNSNFGFLFTGDKPDENELFRTIAHELGHGAFKLKHIFDDKGTEKQATLNLMDYTSTPDKATVLHKYQWDEIIDPRLIAFGWSEENYEELSLPCIGVFDECDQILAILDKIKTFSSEDKLMAFPAFNDEIEKQIVGKYMKIGGTIYSQIRLIFNPIKKAIQIDPKNSIDLDKDYFRPDGSTDRQFGFEYTSNTKDFLRIIIENDTDNDSKRKLLKKYLFGDSKPSDPKPSDPKQEKIKAALDYMNQYLGNDYEQEGGTLRTDLTDVGTEHMDCSEFVSRYLQQACSLSNVPTYNTASMVEFIEQDNEYFEFIEGSDDKDFKEIQPGDILLWRKDDGGGGHTGVVVSYDSTTDQVTIIESIGKSGASEESLSKSLLGYCKGCVRISIYTRNGKALAAHDGWKGYFKPIIKKNIKF